MTFIRKPTEKQRAAIAALREVEGDVDRIFATVAHDERRDFYIRTNKLKSLGQQCAHRILGVRPSSCVGRCGPSGVDHGELFGRNGKPVRFTYQPYGMSSESIDELSAWCKSNGMAWRIDARLSWHFPGWTWLVEIAKDAEFRDAPK